MLRLGKTKLIQDVVDDMNDLSQALKATADYFVNLAMSIKTVAEAIRDNYSASTQAPKVADSPKQKTKPLTIEEVRAVLRPRIPVAGQEAIQNLIRKYGAPLLSNISVDSYAALVTDARELVTDEQIAAYQKAQKEEANAP